MNTTQIKPLYIFDLDGTLSLIDHRLHLLELETSDKWRYFYAACDKDQPNSSVIATLESLRQSGAEVWIFTGRSDEVRHKTINWLNYHTTFTVDELESPMLVMRTLGDYTSDAALKKQWLNEMLPYDRERLIAVFEDRDRVVEMYRSSGITCFQVANGKF